MALKTFSDAYFLKIIFIVHQDNILRQEGHNFSSGMTKTFRPAVGRLLSGLIGGIYYSFVLQEL